MHEIPKMHPEQLRLSICAKLWKMVMIKKGVGMSFQASDCYSLKHHSCCSFFALNEAVWRIYWLLFMCDIWSLDVWNELCLHPDHDPTVSRNYYVFSEWRTGALDSKSRPHAVLINSCCFIHTKSTTHGLTAQKNTKMSNAYNF